MTDRFTITRGASPIVATAIHDGHFTRTELTPLFKLTSEERRREEDPYTANWVGVSDNTIINHYSRFEADVNREQSKAVYRKPEDAWGLQVWKEELPQAAYEESLQHYQEFYKAIKAFFDKLFEVHERLVVYDIHSYNHRRENPETSAPKSDNPEVNIGSQNMNMDIWKPVVSTFIDTASAFDFGGRYLDVRENVKFKGGYFGKFLHETYGDAICPISIEFKKFFMDEWTGQGDTKQIKLVNTMLMSTIEPTLHQLKAIG